MRHRAALTIPIAVVRRARTPLHEQIAAQIAGAVRGGALPGRTQLPSTRTLAELLGVSRGVTEAAYDLLISGGFLDVRPGSGTFVPARHPLDPPPALVETDSSIVDLRPDRYCADAFPLFAWRSAWRRASFGPPPAGPLPPLGVAELRRAVAEHIRRTRGGYPPDGEVVITGGTAHALRLVMDALGLDGPRVAVAEPAPPAVPRSVLGGPAGVPVDAEGIRVDAIPADCRAVVVGPDGQHPLGTILSARRRYELAEWARCTGGHVIETACDRVPRPAASPLPRLGSIVVGGFAELFTPALELGYAVMPRDLAGVVAERIAERAEQPPYVTQLALAALLDSGTAIRLMHRLARRFAHQRRIVDAVLSTIDSHPMDTAVLPLRDKEPEEAAADLLDLGVRVATLAPYYFAAEPPPALVLGYGHLPDAALRRALTVIRAEAVRSGWGTA